MLFSGKRFLTFFCIMSVALCSGSLFAYEQTTTGEVGETSIVLEYPELTTSIAFLESVSIPGSRAMTYCSLIARTNLQRFTGLPIAEGFTSEGGILQGDAIRLIEAGLETNTFLPIKHLDKDMKKWYKELPPYTLFDMYIYTPSQKEHITQEEYLFQGHRVVVLFVEGARRVMDPLRGNSPTRQLWDVYKQYLDPAAYVYLYHQLYTFSDGYAFDFSEKYTGPDLVEVNNLSVLLYKGIIVSELDESFMPVASMFLKTVTLLQQGVSLVLSEGLVVRSMDESPFNIGLLSSSFSVKNDATGSVSITLGGKDTNFSLPVNVSLDIPVLFPDNASATKEYIIQKEVPGSIPGCSDFFDEQGKKIAGAEDERLSFTICRTGTYTIRPVHVVDTE